MDKKRRLKTFDELRNALRPSNVIRYNGESAFPHDINLVYLVERHNSNEDTWEITSTVDRAVCHKIYQTKEEAVTQLPFVADTLYAQTPFMQLLNVLEARFDHLERMIEFSPGNTGAHAAEAHFGEMSNDNERPSKRSRSGTQ